MNYLTKLKVFVKSLTRKDKLYFLLFLIGFLIALSLGTGTITLLLQLINPQIDLKSAAIIVGAILFGLSSLGCFILYYFNRKK